MVDEHAVPNWRNRIWNWMKDPEGAARDLFWPLLFGLSTAILANVSQNYSDTSGFKISFDNFSASAAWGIAGTAIMALYRMLIKIRQHTGKIPTIVTTTMQAEFNRISQVCECRHDRQLSHILTHLRKDSGIEDFDPEHIDYFHGMSERLRSHNPRSIIAIDSSLAHQWWQNSMIGYLAIQARIRLPNGVSRLFVWKPSEMGSDEGRKLIMLHRFLGFDTYIITDMAYRQFLTTHLHECASPESICTHDFLVFDAGPDGVSLDAIGYKSRWNIEHSQEERKRIDAEAKSKLWFAVFEKQDEVNACNTVFSVIKDKAIDYTGGIVQSRHVEAMLSLADCRPVRLNTMEVGELRRALDIFKADADNRERGES